MKSTYSLHKIISDREFSFDPKEYSLFKFGSKNISRKFGTQLGEAFCENVLKHVANGQQFVVISSPYCFIPTATFAMKDYFVRVVNQYLAEHDFPVVEETKIHRTITYKEDYGELSAEERFRLIKNDGFHIDAEFIKGKTLILLDDVKITGSHERVIEGMLDRMGLDNDRIYCYFGEMTNQLVDPKVENYINYAFVKGLKDLDKIIKNDEFILNTRIVKYMLNANAEEFKEFATYQKLELLSSVYNCAIGNSYHKIPDYITNLSHIEKLISDDTVDSVFGLRRHSIKF